VDILQICDCYYGICVVGESNCSECLDNYYGPSCNVTCTCVNGYFEPSGICQCFKDFYGNSCEQRCIDSNCSIQCPCESNCTENICYNDLSIINQNISITSADYIFEGNFIINNSQIDFNSLQLSVDKNLTLSQSTIIFNSSSIITKGCISLSNAILKVDLSKLKSGNILLMNSTSGCLSGNYSILYLNQPKCTNLNSEMNSFSLIIVIVPSNCESPTASESTLIILIVVCSIVGVVIVAFLIILIIPEIRRKIFPINDDAKIINK